LKTLCSQEVKVLVPSKEENAHGRVSRIRFVVGKKP
jgi:hypothetical protein